MLAVSLFAREERVEKLSVYNPKKGFLCPDNFSGMSRHPWQFPAQPNHRGKVDR